MSSIEEQIEDIAKKQLDDIKVKYFTKTESINSEIDEALRKAPSKNGGDGCNYPDIKLFLQTKTGRKIPVMIEVKGTKGDLVKYNELNEIENIKKDGTPHYANIKKYAVNGAIHYANAIIDYTQSYSEVIAIGMNGYKDVTKDTITELGVYYVSKDNFSIPKEIGKYSDLSFLSKRDLNSLVEKIETLNLSDEEIEKRTSELENKIEKNLKILNQEMRDVHSISEDYRVKLISGLIMAGLGIEKNGECIVSPLELTDLKGKNESKTHDGYVILNKIESFLAEKKLPDQKREMIKEVLQLVFVHSKLHVAENGESKLKKIYASVKKDILPFFISKYHIDFTGRLFNVLNAWVKVPDGNQNDVVLTPRYVCELMAKLCKVNKDSYVWDYAVGSAGFLIAAMKQMIKDAENNITSCKELETKIAHIKYHQLLGVEKLPDIYMLAVLNMIG